MSRQQQRARDLAYAQNHVEEWNAAHSPCERVTYRRDDGSFLHATTAGKAFVLRSGRAAINLADKEGYFLLDRIQGD